MLIAIKVPIQYVQFIHADSKKMRDIIILLIAEGFNKLGV